MERASSGESSSISSISGGAWSYRALALGEKAVMVKEAEESVMVICKWKTVSAGCIVLCLMAVD